MEFVGPCRFGGWTASGAPIAVENVNAWVQITGVSKDQTKNTMIFFASIFTKECLVRHGIDLAQQVIYAHAGARRLEVTSSSHRSLEGNRPSFVVRNEALALDTPIPTPTGWKTMGDLVDGDVIYGSDGRPTVVTKVHEIQHGRRCFEVAFADGSKITASDGHLWSTRIAGSAAEPRVRTTLEMLEDGRRFLVPAPGVRTSPPVELPVDPYLLGAWLGDGSTGQPNITAGDEDLVAMREQLERRGIATHLLSRQEDRAARIAFSSRRGFGAEVGTDVAKALRALSCYRDKHIPSDYLDAGHEQRLELLRGLMDTDGCLTGSGRAIFVGRERLARDVLALCRSLGQDARISFAPDERSREGGSWRVAFTPKNGVVPFSLPRKADRVRPHRRGPAWEPVTSIREVESVPVRCISVDAPDRLFLAGPGGHATHNTHHWITANDGHELAKVIRRNLGKIKGGQARALSITNAYRPGEGSVGEVQRQTYLDLMERRGAATLLYDSLEAPVGATLVPEFTGWDGEGHEVRELRPDGTPIPPSLEVVREHLRRILTVVRGDADWLDIERLVEDILSGEMGVEDAKRFYFNSISLGDDAAFDPEDIRLTADAEMVAARQSGTVDPLRCSWLKVAPTDPVVMFGDGSKSEDSTGLIGCRLSDGYVFTIGVWQKPKGDRGRTWLAPRDEIDARVHEAFGRFNIVAFWFDPSHTKDDENEVRYWDTLIDGWHVKYADRLQYWAVQGGDRRSAIMWDMTSPIRQVDFVAAVQRFSDELASRVFGTDGHPSLLEHLRHARNSLTAHGWSISKVSRSSSNKIDLAVCAVGARMLRRLVMLKGLEEEESVGRAWWAPVS